MVQDLIAAFIAADTVLPPSPSRPQLPPPPAAAASGDAATTVTSSQAAAAAADPLAEKGTSCSSAAAEVQAVCTDASLAAAEAAPGSEIMPAPTTAPGPTSIASASPVASPPQGASACRNLDFVRSPAVLEVHPDSSTPAVAVPPSPPAPPAPAVYATALAQVGRLAVPGLGEVPHPVLIITIIIITVHGGANRTHDTGAGAGANPVHAVRCIFYENRHTSSQ